MRDAKNRDALIERTREVCGVTIQVLSGEEEAQMAYGGSSRLLRPYAKTA